MRGCCYSLRLGYHIQFIYLTKTIFRKVVIIMNHTLFVGIDVSLKSNQVYAMNFNEDKLLNSSFANTPEGSELFVSKIVEIINQYKFDKVLFAMECTGVYYIHIATFLSTHPTLNNLNCFVYTVNAKSIDKYKDSYIEIEKTDPTDAFIIADFIRVGRTKSLSPFKGSQFLALQRLTRQRKHLADQISKEKCYVSANIFLKFSAISNSEEKVFCNTFGKTSSSILTDFLSTEDIINTPIDELVDFISIKGKNRFKNPEDKANILVKAARDSYRLDKVSYEAVGSAIASSLTVINCLQNEIKNVDNAISKVIKGFDNNYYQILLSVPGIGPVFAAGIMAEIIDISFFKSHNQLAKYAGLYWPRHQSGEFEHSDKPMAKSGNMYLKYYVTEATNRARIKDPIFKQFYENKFIEAKTHQHKRALALSSRKFIRLIFGLLCKNQLYVPNKLDSLT